MGFGPDGLPVAARLGGRDVTLPVAAPVVESAARGDWWSLVPCSLDRGSRAYVVRRLADPRDRLDFWLLHRVAMRLLGEGVFGVPWHVACRLLATASENWLGFSVWCVRHGVDPQRVEPHRVVSAVYAWVAESVSGQENPEREWSRVESKLWAPPDGADPDGWDEGEAELAQRAMQQLA